jgi:heme/copper-type cytochrome/quinol oxidase subunit 3
LSQAAHAAPRGAGAAARSAAAAAHSEHYTSLGIDSRKLGMWLLIASECLLFGSLIVTYLIFHDKTVNPPTPKQILNIPVTTISTFVLLMSSFSIVLSLAGIQRGDRKAFEKWILITAFGGLTFLGFQVYEFTQFVHEGLGFTTNTFGSSFFLLTGTHGTHVAVGVLWLFALFFTSKRGGLVQDGALKVDTMALYWHFVDVIWIIIFTVVYLFSVL